MAQIRKLFTEFREFLGRELLLRTVPPLPRHSGNSLRGHPPVDGLDKNCAAIRAHDHDFKFVTAGGFSTTARQQNGQTNWNPWRVAVTGTETFICNLRRLFPTRVALERPPMQDQRLSSLRIRKECFNAGWSAFSSGRRSLRRWVVPALSSCACAFYLRFVKDKLAKLAVLDAGCR